MFVHHAIRDAEKTDPVAACFSRKTARRDDGGCYCCARPPAGPSAIAAYGSFRATLPRRIRATDVTPCPPFAKSKMIGGRTGRWSVPTIRTHGGIAPRWSRRPDNALRLEPRPTASKHRCFNNALPILIRETRTAVTVSTDNAVRRR